MGEDIKETELILYPDGRATLHNNDYGDDGRSDAIMWGEKMEFSGTWSKDTSDSYAVTFTKRTLRRWTTYPGFLPRDFELSPPASLKVSIEGLQVKLLDPKGLT